MHTQPPACDFIDGQFSQPKNQQGQLQITSPADHNDVVGKFTFSQRQVEQATNAARVALFEWQNTPLNKRCEMLLRYSQALENNKEHIALSICREIGKPLWEARTEIDAMVNKVRFCVDDMDRWADVTIAAVPGELRRKALGVVAVIGPFNFPGHLPNGQFVPALLAGNTVVFKPSEKSPHTATWIARCMEQAQAPAGVFNVVQGPGIIAESIVQSNEVDGILFTGSARVGQRILENNLRFPGRLVALELGGKNASIVLDDCHVEAAARQVAFAGYATTGQRCTATSRVYVTRAIAENFTQALVKAATSISVGHPAGQVFMGPMISEESRASFVQALQAAQRVGFEALTPNGLMDVEDYSGYYVYPSVHFSNQVLDAPEYTDCELFGPDIAVQVVEDIEQAIDHSNASPFGLAAAVFTRSKANFEIAAQKLRVGVLQWNRSTAGASGLLPFGGVKQSGNHHPVGSFAFAQCSYPQAVHFSANPDSLPSWPGFPSPA